VTTVTLGPTDDFPAFFCRSSGSKSMAAIATPRECAELVHANATLGLGSGMVIGVPIPEAHAQDPVKVQCTVYGIV
jgi:pseudouridine-5'-phosphate glycosidase